MKLSTYFDRSLMTANLCAENSEGVIRQLGALLVTQGKVTKEYIQAVIEREQKFPTGLPTPEIKVAIPHTGTAFVKQSAIAVATLQQPVPFYLMGESEKQVGVQVVFLLAIHEKTGQVEALQSLIQLLQDNDLLRSAAAAASDEALYQLILEKVLFIETLEEVP